MGSKQLLKNATTEGKTKSFALLIGLTACRLQTVQFFSK